MTLKNYSSKLFDLSLILANLKRTLWLPTLAFIGFFFALPVTTALTMQNTISQLSNSNLPKVSIAGAEAMSDGFTSLMKDVLTTNQGFTVFLVCVGAIMTAVTVFRYLHNHKQVDFFHSLPLKRSKLFVTQWVTGLLIFLIPYLAGTLLNILVIAAFNGSAYTDWSAYFTNILLNILFYLAIFGVTSVAAMLSGTTIISLKITGVLLGIGPAAILLYVGFSETFYEFYYEAMINLTQWIGYSSPLLRYIFASFQDMGLPMKGLDYLLLLVFIAATILCSFYLYQIRPSECAGKALAFNKSKLWIKLPIVALSSIASAFIFYSIGNNKAIWLLFGTIIGGLIISQFLEIVYAADFKAIKKGLLSSSIVILLVCGVLLAGKYDLTGFDEYLPNPQEVASINLIMDMVDQYAEDNNGYDDSSHNSREHYRLEKLTLTDAATKQAVFNICSQAINPSPYPEGSSFTEQPSGTEQLNYPINDLPNTSFKVVYTLNNGKKVGRVYYNTPIATQAEDFKTIIDDAAYGEKLFSLYNIAPEALFLENANNFQYGIFQGMDYTLEEQKALIQAYIQEHKNLSLDSKVNEIPIGQIAIRVYKNTEDLPQDTSTLYNNGDEKHRSFYILTYPIYQEFTQTISLLQAKNPQISFGNNVVNLEDITVRSDEQAHYQQKDPSYQTSTPEAKMITDDGRVMIKDPAKMEQILNTTYAEEAISYNIFAVIDRSKYYQCTYTNFGQQSRCQLQNLDLLSLQKAN